MKAADAHQKQLRSACSQMLEKRSAAPCADAGGKAAALAAAAISSAAGGHSTHGSHVYSTFLPHRSGLYGHTSPGLATSATHSRPVVSVSSKAVADWAPHSRDQTVSQAVREALCAPPDVAMVAASACRHGMPHSTRHGGAPAKPHVQKTVPVTLDERRINAVQV